MSHIDDGERRLLRTLSDLTYCNPFEPARIELERVVLGDAYTAEPLGAWSRTEATDRSERPNVVAITRRVEELAEDLRRRQSEGSSLRGADAVLYDDLITYSLYYVHFTRLPPGLIEPAPGDRDVAELWRAFTKDRQRFLAPVAAAERKRLPTDAHLFACLHQVRRAFNGIFRCLIGESGPATRLRAAVWQSIFTHDLRRYRRSLYNRMAEMATLVTGPSGAGKELVAQAVGRAQYLPFDPEAEAFAGGDGLFTALNLSALSPTLIESELFGHAKGSFTGATGNRVGWLERCPSQGAVFLDEIGELDPSIQVKLLRVVQSRDYSRLGESKPRRFLGKLLAATNRDLAAEMRAGRFREDFYYRLCSDRVTVPSLHEQLADRPEAMAGLVRFLTKKLLGEADEAESLAVEVEGWIAQRLPANYVWPGNIRELEQCVRSVLVRREYHPATAPTETSSRPDWLARAERGELTADELLDAYCRQVHRQRGGYEPAARALGLDRRTVKARVHRVLPG